MLIKLVGKHFHKNNKYHKIFNLITLKLSYCCTTNVGNIIKQHNSKVLSKTNDSNNYKCNCRSKSFNGELNGECLTQCEVYKAHLQHPTTALFTMELLKGSSKHSITTKQKTTLSGTVNA